MASSWHDDGKVDTLGFSTTPKVVEDHCQKQI
jgi:hypothetical protein